ncbi:MAG: hypothetical protein COZ34_02060 [Candidatus Pacebacteria bacterium CG_4_10_14_3_um_filter_34_15]|nr:MAG: hypothetical protein COZ34_02060 [Candidatus Pacebacteria bacterium CG_4_10_14_3_um_filter_34_15]
MIRPEKKTIEGILKGSDYKFSVPPYQRSFDWGKTELQELMDDLKETKGEDTKDLFLGNFIFDISEKNNYKIVDGQQRLTTISIILIALREHAKKINESEFAGELQGLIAISSAWSGEQGNKISVSENIRDIFEYISNREWDGIFPEKIGNKSVKRQVNKVKPIFNYVLNELSSYNKADLTSFTKALLFSYVIVIEVENTEDVFSIFERTNARGLDLNIGDLLKNYIFSYEVEAFEEKWNEIIANAESSLQRMLKYFWIARRGHIQQSQLYKSLKSYGKELGIEQFVNDLYSFSRYYKAAQSQDQDIVKDWLEEVEMTDLSKNEDYYKKINRTFQALKLFRVTQAYPLIYSIFKSYKEDGAKNSKKLFKTLETIENYHFVNNVISGRIGNEVEKFYSNNSMKFFNGNENFATLTDAFNNGLRKKKAHKEEFVSNFIENVTYENIPLINYVFDRINNFDTKGGQRVDIFSPEKDLKKRNLNIEHILSQNLKKQYGKEEDLELFDKIGNLLIISRHSNSGLPEDPAEKIKVFESDPKHSANLRYLHDFFKEYKNDFENWDFEVIKKRSKNIAENGYDQVWNF